MGTRTRLASFCIGITAMFLTATGTVAADSEHGVDGYLLRASVDRSEEAGRDWENPVELIAFAAPASAPAAAPAPEPAPEPAPAPAPAPAPEAASGPPQQGDLSPEDYLAALNEYWSPDRVVESDLRCADSPFHRPAHVEELKRLPEFQQEAWCKAQDLAGYYQQFYWDFFDGKTINDMFPDNPDPRIDTRGVYGSTTPFATATSYNGGGWTVEEALGDGRWHQARFDLQIWKEQYSISVTDEWVSLDDDARSAAYDEYLATEWQPTTIDPAWLLSRVDLFGYCMELNPVTVIDHVTWEFDCSLTNFGRSTEALDAYHPDPNGYGPSSISITVGKDAVSGYVSIYMLWSGIPGLER